MRAAEPLSPAARARLKARFDAIPKKLRDAAEDALKKQAEKLVKEMQRAAPVDDGDLRRSIRMSNQSNDIGVRYRVEAGGPLTTKPVRNGAEATYDYSRSIEFGDFNSPAQPFFRPARDKAVKRTRGAVKRAIKKALEG